MELLYIASFLFYGFSPSICTEMMSSLQLAIDYGLITETEATQLTEKCRKVATNSAD